MSRFPFSSSFALNFLVGAFASEVPIAPAYITLKSIFSCVFGDFVRLSPFSFASFGGLAVALPAPPVAVVVADLRALPLLAEARLALCVLDARAAPGERAVGQRWPRVELQQRWYVPAWQ